MMMIAPNSSARKGGKERGEMKGSTEELEGKSRGILTKGELQPSQQHGAPCVKGFERGLGTRGLSRTVYILFLLKKHINALG